MAKKQKEQDGVLVKAATAIGKAVGKMAVLTGLEKAPSRPKVGKLPKKNKARLPRKQKKAQQKTSPAKV